MNIIIKSDLENKKSNIEIDNKTYVIETMEYEIDPKNEKVFHKFAIDVLENHKKKFLDIDTTNFSEDEYIKYMTDRYMFYIQYIPKNHIDADNDLEVAKYQYIIQCTELIKSLAEEHNLKEKLSHVLTNLKCMPICDILIKYGKHLFQYADDVKHMSDIRDNLNINDPFILDALNPKTLMYGIQENLIENLILAHFCLNLEEKNKIKKIIDMNATVSDYLDTFRSYFSDEFCKDYREIYTYKKPKEKSQNKKRKNKKRKNKK